MKMRTFVRNSHDRHALSYLALIGSLLAGTQIAAAENMYVSVTQATQNMPSLVKAIAKYGEETTVHVAKGESLVEAIERHCGQVDPTYLAIASGRNFGVSPTVQSIKETIVRLPACILGPTPKTVPIAGANNLTTLTRANKVKFIPIAAEKYNRYKKLHPAFAYLDGEVAASLPGTSQSANAANVLAAIEGASTGDAKWDSWMRDTPSVVPEGEQVLDAFGQAPPFSSSPNKVIYSANDWRSFTQEIYGMQNANAIAYLNGLESLDRISNIRPVVLPGLNPLTTTVRLNKEYNQDAAIEAIRVAYSEDLDNQTKESSKRSDETAGKAVRESTGAFLVSPATSASCGAGQTVHWPFDSTAIVEQIGYNRGFVGLGFSSTPGILILDTGFDFYGPDFNAYFPEANKQRIRSLKPYHVAGASRRVGTKFVDGINVATRNSSSASFFEDPDRWHGLAVAGAALGTREFERFRHAFSLPLRLSFANVVRISGGLPLIEVNGLQETIRHVTNTDVKIINISFLVPSVIPQLSSVLSTYGSGLVLVVAAGNDGKSVTEKNTFPAKFGGEFSNAPDSATVITVGAHDRNGKKSDFSSYDESRVDLLAPGCEIASYAGTVSKHGRLKLERASWAGTSFAAPIVSFTAGLLGAYGLKPAEIKARIIVSADVSEDLKDVVFARGRLNVLKALSFNFDQFEIKQSGKRIRILVAPSDDGPSTTGLQNPLLTVCGQERRLRDFAKIARDPELGSKGKWHIWLNPTSDETMRKLKRKELCEPQVGDHLQISITDSLSGEEFQVSLDNLVDLIPRR